MSRTKSRYINFQELGERGDSALLVVKLMMACNDLQLANESQSDWERDQPPARKPRQVGARMYFVRLQLSHLFEGLKVIEQVKNDLSLQTLIETMDAESKNSFARLEEYLPGGPKHQRFESLFAQVRGNLTFHYDEHGKEVRQAIKNRSASQQTRITSITRGNSAYFWHFKAADDIVDDIVVRRIFKIPQNSDVPDQVDKVMMEFHQVFLWFVDFSGEFIWRYCEG